VVIANLTAVIGSIMMARAAKVAGIALPGSAAARRVAQMVAIVVAVAIVGMGVWKDLHHLGGDKDAIVAVASSIGDVVVFSVIAPFLLTALAMRGGVLAWPWALLTAANCSWLIYDMSASFERQWAIAEPTLKTFEELWRALACALALSAGLAQRWALRSSGRAARAAKVAEG
jgi:hypothetical protein